MRCDTLQEMTLYRNFNELADDVLELAKEILPDQLLYLTTIEENQQMILRLSNDHQRIEIRAGQVFEMEKTLCRHINFEKNEPIWYESISDDERLDRVLSRDSDQLNEWSTLWYVVRCPL